MRKTVLTIAFATGALASAPSCAQDTMTGDQLATIAERARSFAPRDKFDTPPPVTSVAGKRFSYIVSPLERGPDNAMCDGFPSWGYWAPDQRLEVGATPGYAISYDLRGKNGTLFSSAIANVVKNSELNFFSFTCSKIDGGSYTAQNGYGATFEVKRTTDVVTAVADFGDIVDRRWKPYWSTTVSGDTARSLSKNVRIRVSGMLRDWPSGESILCGTDTREATASRPVEDKLDVCMFRGRVDTIEILDVGSGAVLYTAKR